MLTQGVTAIIIISPWGVHYFVIIHRPVINYSLHILYQLNVLEQQETLNNMPVLREGVGKLWLLCATSC